jgi:hypothetical protein
MTHAYISKLKACCKNVIGLKITDQDSKNIGLRYLETFTPETVMKLIAYAEALREGLKAECCCPGVTDYQGKEILCDPCNIIEIQDKILADVEV